MSPTSDATELDDTATRRASPHGFTLLELMVVLAIIGMLMGISVGLFRRGAPSRDVARNAVLDMLRRAKLFAMSEQSPATVELETPTEGWPVVSASGRKTVGEWHLEGNDFEGFPFAARATGAVEELEGAVGKAVRLDDSVPSYIDFGTAGSFDSTDGFACEFFVNVDRRHGQVLLSKGRSFILRGESDGNVSCQICLIGRDERGDPRDVFESAASTEPVLEPGRFTKLAVTFDGISLRLAADDVAVAENVLTRRLPFKPERDQALLFGATDAPAACAVDEMKWGIYAKSSEELKDMKIGGRVHLVRFGPDGTLDPLFHGGPAELCLLTPPADETKKPLETWVTVGLLGDVH